MNTVIETAVGADAISAETEVCQLERDVSIYELRVLNIFRREI